MARPSPAQCVKDFPQIVISPTFGRDRLAYVSRGINTSVTKPARSADRLQFDRLVQAGNRRLLRSCALVTVERAMSEAEFDRLLDVVQTAIAPMPEEDFVAHGSTFHQPPKAANDNQHAWPLVPFPEGWNAVC
jgi:hypothetical protein